MPIQLPITPVFEKNWNAINERDETGKRKYRYIVNKGSSRSSKTYSLIDVVDVYARMFKRKRITVWRDTKINCKRTVLHDMLEHHRSTYRYERGYKHNQTESVFKYDNGSTMEIHGADESNKVHGLTQDVAWLNEPYDITKAVFDQIDQRTSDFILLDWNPSMAHFIDELVKDPRTIVIHSTFRDNPFCPEEQKNKILSYQPVSASEVVKKKIMTDLVARYYDCGINMLSLTPKQCRELTRCQHNESIGTANSYNWSVYGLGEKAEKPNRIFNWTRIDIHEYRKIDVKRYYGVDWGKVDPWGIVEVKYLDGCLYIHELNYDSEDLHRKRMNKYEKSQVSSMDGAPDASDAKEGIVKWLFEKLDIPYDAEIICDNNRPKKILALRNAGWDYAIAADGLKAIKDGIDTLNNLKVFFTSESPNIEAEQQNYSHKVDRNGNVLEEPEDKNNHTIDPIRYVAQYLENEGIINIV